MVHNEDDFRKIERRQGLQEILLELRYIKRDIEEIKADIKEDKENYITRAEFDPYKKILQGLVGLILTAVVGAVLSLIFRD